MTDKRKPVVVCHPIPGWGLDRIDGQPGTLLGRWRGVATIRLDSGEVVSLMRSEYVQQKAAVGAAAH